MSDIAMMPTPVSDDLGACCGCGRDDRPVRTIVALPYTAPVPGTGWGCVLCRIPNDGAMAVLCDECVQTKRDPVEVCCGYPLDKQRETIGEWPSQPFDHDRTVEHV